jgi:extracellular elastinolytic metalloproteinase
VNNYGRGGVGGDDVQAEAQDGGGTNNANFSTPAADGGRPRMQMYLWPSQTPVRDGDLDNGIIIHEYGHGVSNRLTGGPKTANCLTGNEQAGEGWSDYLAITLTLDPALDDPDEPRGMGTYALFQDDRHGAGIRPRPYTRDMSIQPFTYDSIKTDGWLNGTSLALPHGLGHGWAATLWDLDWDLIDKHGFNPNVYGAWDSGGNNRAIQYVIDGLKMQGCGPGLVVARGAIVAAADALGGEDTCTVWAAFARRGLGFSAVQGTTNRDDNAEAFDTHPSCRRGFQSPVTQPYGALNEVDAGEAVPLRFTADGYRQLDVLKDSGSPFSRRVDCTTLQVPSESPPFITPRERPVATETPGGSRLTVNAQGVFVYPWKTLEAWAGTCRELVLTRDDGRQHRAFFRFL